MDQDKPITDKELLTENLNHWRNELFTRTASMKQAELEKKRDPKKMLLTPEGRQVTISAVAEGRKSMVREALQFVTVFKELLQASKEGTLHRHWNEDALREGIVLHSGQSFPVKGEEDTGLVPQK